MYFSDFDIENAVKRSSSASSLPATGLLIEQAPDFKSQLQPASFDVCFDGPLYVMELPEGPHPFVNLFEREDDEMGGDFSWELRHEIPDGGWLLHPGEFALAQTIEIVHLGDAMTATLHGRSTTGRCGLEVHRTAGWIDPGFRGTITLEISNAGTHTLRIRRGDRIAQLAFAPLFAQLSAREPYRGIYQGQKTTTKPERGPRHR